MKRVTYAQAVKEALWEEMKRDESIFIIGEEVGTWGNIFGVTQGFLEEFGEERVKDTPISESAIVGCALGAALVGCRPVAEIMYMDFVTCAMDQICNQLAKIRYMSGGNLYAPMVLRTQGGGGRGQAAQHSQSLEAWFMHIPGLKVVLPSTPADAKGLLKTSIRDDDPVIFVENKMLYFTSGDIPDDGDFTIELGVADVKKEGSDVTVVATSRQVLFSLEAAQEMEREGISVEVIDPRTLVPLDKETIFRSLAKTHKLVVVNEGNLRCGVTSEIAAMVQEEAFDLLDAPVKRVAAPNVPMPYCEQLESYVIPNKERIAKAVRDILAA